MRVQHRRFCALLVACLIAVSSVGVAQKGTPVTGGVRIPALDDSTSRTVFPNYTAYLKWAAEDTVDTTKPWFSSGGFLVVAAGVFAVVVAWRFYRKAVR